MSVQVLLYGKLLGIEEFLEPAAHRTASDESLLAGRAQWMTLLGEVLPRALLAEFGYSRILLGSSGGGQFLLVLPEEARDTAREFLSTAGRQIRQMSGGKVSLVCASTENLGDWAVVRKRLFEDLQRQLGAPAARFDANDFQPFPDPDGVSSDEYFTELAGKLWQAENVGWNPENPARVEIGTGKHTWSLVGNRGGEEIPVARHAAPSEDGTAPASLETLAERATGRRTWGVLRGDVDGLRVRIRRLQTIEEHVRLSVLYKQFFAGELEVVCSQPEFWRKVTVLYSGGDDFAVYGSWDALIPFARELQRLFHRFTEENLKEFPGPEGKTITMALALAPEPGASLGAVYYEAGQQLEIAKDADKDCISVLGRILEWRHLGDAADLKDTLARMVTEFGSSRQFLNELSTFYRKGNNGSSGGERFDKPWRFQRRLNRILTGARDREVQKLRQHLANEMMGRGAAKVKLRPAGLVALEWARLFTEV